jgi:hypothetical protein
VRRRGKRKWERRGRVTEKENKNKTGGGRGRRRVREENKNFKNGGGRGRLRQSKIKKIKE